MNVGAMELAMSLVVLRLTAGDPGLLLPLEGLEHSITTMDLPTGNSRRLALRSGLVLSIDQR